MNIETDTLLNDIEQSYIKLNTECKKKYTSIKEAIESTLKSIESLRKRAFNNESIFLALSEELPSFLLPLQRLTEAKLTKLLPISILIIKIIVGYRVLTPIQYNGVIALLKDIFYLSSEDYHSKLLDVLEEIVNYSLMEINEDVVLKIVSICLKLFCLKNNNDVKYNVTTIFTSFIKSIYTPIKEKLNKLNEVAPSVITTSNHFKGALILLESVLDIVEGKNKEFSSQATLSKCFALEMVSYTLTHNSDAFMQIPEMTDVAKEDLAKCLQRTLDKDNDYWVTLKMCRCALVLIHKIGFGYELIQQFIRMSETKDIGWLKWLGIECLSSILNSPQAVMKMYQSIQLTDAFMTSFHRTIRTINLMVLEINTSPLKKKESFEYYNVSRGKALDNDSILIESEPVPSVNTMMLYALLVDCLENYKNSIMKILVSKEIVINELNTKLTKEQSDIKEMIKFKNDFLRESLTDAIEKSCDEDITLRYLNLFQNFIHIYGSICLPNARDSYIQNLCDLAIPGNAHVLQDLPDKNFCVIKTLFNIVSFVNLLETSSWVILLQTMQNISYVINRFNQSSDRSLEYNAECLIRTLEDNIEMYSLNTSKSITRITNANDTSLQAQHHSFNDSVTKASDTNNSKSPKGISDQSNHHVSIISNLINSLLLTSDTYQKDTLEQIINAIHTNCRKMFDFTVNEATASYLMFHLKKMLTLAWVNCFRIEAIYSPLSEVANFLVKKNIRSLSQFTLDIHTMIIINEINNYKPSENGHEEWNCRDFQRSLLIPLMKEASQNISDDINVALLSNLSKVLELCGCRLSVFGWSTFIETCSIMLNQNVQNQFELTFKVIESIMNSYSQYLNVYNITPILNILEAFTFYQSNNAICLTAIEHFKTCAEITEKYQLLDESIPQSQIDFFNQFHPDAQSKEEFFSQLWKNIYFKLININSDDRFEIRKKGIKVISSIFIEKMGNISHLNCESIIKDIFAAVLKTNAIHYKEKLNSKDKGEGMEWEETSVESLFALEKALKAYFATCDNNLKTKELYKEFMEQCSAFVSFCSPNFIIQINKANTDLINDNSRFIVLNFKFYWNYLNKLIEYFSTESFMKKYENDAIGVVVVIELVQNVRKIIESYMQLSHPDESLFLLLISYYQQLLSCGKLFERSIIDGAPSKLLNCEKEVFQVIDENISKSTSKTEIAMLFEFLTNHLTFHKKNEHSEALCRRSLQSLVLLHSNEHFNYEEYINDLLLKLKPMIFVRNNPEMVETIMKRKPKSLSTDATEGDFLWNQATTDLILIIQKIITNLQAESIWNIIMDYIEAVFKESNNGFKKISRAYQDELIKSLQKVEIAHIGLLVNYLVPNSIFVSQEIQLKLCELLDLAAHIDYSSVSNNSSAISKVCLSNLFELSKYKSEDDLRKEQPLYSEENLNRYVSIKVRIAKMCTPILIKRCREIMKKFLSDEVKSGSMPLSRARLDEIKFILENLSNLEIYPHYTIIDEHTRLPDEDGLEDKETIMGVVSKTKKTHLFLLHPILSQFIATKENDIKLLIKELFGKISKEMGIKSG